MTVRQHYTSVAQQTNQSFDELIASLSGEHVAESERLPPPAKYPKQLDYLRVIYRDMARARTYENIYARPLSATEMKAYIDLHQLKLDVEEIQALMQVDDAWVNQFNIERVRRAAA